MTEELTIGEVARRAGIRTSAIHDYESVGLLPAPARVNGHRRYDPAILQGWPSCTWRSRQALPWPRFKTLLHGFAPDTPPAERWEALARRKLDEVDVLIQRARRMKEVLEIGLRCGCLRLEDCVIVDDERCGSTCLPPTSMESGALIKPRASSSGASL